MKGNQRGPRLRCSDRLQVPDVLPTGAHGALTTAATARHWRGNALNDRKGHKRILMEGWQRLRWVSYWNRSLTEAVTSMQPVAMRAYLPILPPR